MCSLREDAGTENGRERSGALYPVLGGGTNSLRTEHFEHDMRGRVEKYSL